MKEKEEEKKEKIMDEFVFVHKLQRAIKQNLAALSINVTSGGVDNFDKYKYITGQISALESVHKCPIQSHFCPNSIYIWRYIYSNLAT